MTEVESLVAQYKNLSRRDRKMFLSRIEEVFVEEALMRGPPIPKDAPDDTIFYMTMGKIMSAVYVGLMEKQKEE